jgi:hypothetical protein
MQYLRSRNTQVVKIQDCFYKVFAVYMQIYMWQIISAAHDIYAPEPF